MSIETWKEEFYPETAQKAAKVSELYAIEHSLRKWSGFEKEALNRHGLAYQRFSLRDADGDGEDLFTADRDTCALCARHPSADRGNRMFPMDCSACSLALSRGGVSCDECTSREADSPYRRSRNSPKRMLQVLRRAKEFVEKADPK